MVAVEAAGITDVGQKRSGNEDSLFLDENLNLFIVADGMGGHQAGEVASSIVVETIKDYISRYGDNHQDNEEFENFDNTLSKRANHLLASIHLANQGVYKVANSNAAYRGMGSTVSAICFTDNTIIAANVGDSPIYYIHEGDIENLYVPHTVMAEQAAIDPDGSSKLGSQFAHMLTQGMGIKETVEPDICEIQGFKGDILVSCSDGLSDKVSPIEIMDIVCSEKPDKACRSLVDLANERGGDDNITVIILRIKRLSTNSGIMGFFSKFGNIFKGFFQ